MESKQKISFIIINYKDSPYLDKCIASIFKNATNFPREIIIVNNLSKYFNISQNVKILEISENKGFGNACNIGAREAQGKIFCFLNPDTEMISNDFEKIISEFEKDKKIGIIGPKLINENNNIQEWCVGVERNFWDIAKNNFGLKSSQKIWKSEKKTECAWVSGASMFIRKDLFEKLGGFDEKFFLYFEDTDLCKRARNLNYKILYFPKFTVKHFGGRSFDSIKEQKKHYYSSQDYYFEKHFGKITANLVKLISRLFK